MRGQPPRRYRLVTVSSADVLADLLHRGEEGFKSPGILNPLEVNGRRCGGQWARQGQGEVVDLFRSGDERRLSRRMPRQIRAGDQPDAVGEVVKGDQPVGQHPFRVGKVWIWTVSLRYAGLEPTDGPIRQIADQASDETG